MGFFSSKGKECWLCRRNISEEGMFLNPEAIKMIFEDVFKNFLDEDLKLDDICLCKICAGILKYTAQDSVAARIRISDASEKLKDKLGGAKSSFMSRAKEAKNKISDKMDE